MLRLTASLVMFLTVSLTSQVAGATPELFNKLPCKKIGQIRTVGKAQQTCSLVNKKKVWVPVRATKWTPATTMTTNLDTCKLLDQRDASLRNSPRSLGFPLIDTGTPTAGVINLVLIAADFPGYRGTAAELSKLKTEISLFNKWLAFQSGGRLSANWQFPNSWIQLAKNPRDYGVVGFDPKSHRSLVNEIIGLSDSQINFSNVPEIFVYFPDSLTKSEPNRDPFQGVLPQIGGTDIQTQEGVVKHLKGSGTVSQMIQYRNVRPTLWAIWAHDLLHILGIEGHNPVESATLETEDFVNNVMSSWNQFLIGWTSDSQVACLDLNTLNGNEVDLAPLQTNLDGYRSAIIPINDHRAIVIESHRNIGYASKLGASGVIVYLMDTKNVPTYERREETSLIGSRFLDPTTVQNGSRGRVGNGRKSSIMLPGEKVVFNEITITFTQSGQKDKIRFSLNK